jgi:hypothetical protein
LEEALCKNVFKKAINIIELSGSKIEDKEALKSKKMTEQILTALKEILNPYKGGKILSFSSSLKH